MAVRTAKKNARGKAKVAARGEPRPVSAQDKQAKQERTTQLATRVRADLHMAMKIHVVKTGGTIMDFVESACLRELRRVSQESAAA